MADVHTLFPHLHIVPVFEGILPSMLSHAASVVALTPTSSLGVDMLPRKRDAEAEEE